MVYLAARARGGMGLSIEITCMGRFIPPRSKYFSQGRPARCVPAFPFRFEGSPGAATICVRHPTAQVGFGSGAEDKRARFFSTVPFGIAYEDSRRRPGAVPRWHRSGPPSTVTCGLR